MSMEMRSTSPLASILIVDDTPVNLGVIVEGLEELGYEVLVAQDGEEALRRAALTTPDLILLDIMLPGWDGFEVCQRLKAQANTRDIPVIFMSALDGVQDKVAGFQVGAVDFVTKPVQIDEVQARIGLHLKLRAMQRQLETQNTRLQREIAERQRMEASLDQERATLQAFFRTLPELVWMKGLDGRYLLCNPLFEHFVGNPESGVIGKTDFDFVDARQAQSFRETDRRAQADGSYKTDAEWIRDASNGRDALFEITKRAVRDAQGQMIGVLGIARDITERRRTEYALAASEKKYRSVFESASDGIFLHRIAQRADGKEEFVLHDVNHKGCELLGTTREILLAGQFNVQATCRPPFTLAAAIQYYRLAAQGHLQQYDWEFVRSDASVIWCEVNLRRIDIGGEGFLLAVMRDVSGRVRLENALAAQAAEYQTVLGNSPDCIARYDATYRLRYANPAFEEMVSSHAGRLLGKSPVETWGTQANLSQAQAFQSHLQRILDSGEATIWEFALITECGQRTEYQTRGVPEFDARGRVCGVLTVSRDISALKRAQAALDESEQRYREVFENASDGLYLIEVLGERRFRNLEVNPTLLRAMGWKSEDVVGRLVHETAVPSVAKIYVDRYQQCVSTGVPLREEVALNRITGRKVFESTVIPLRNAEGRIYRLVGISHDITAQRQLEVALEEKAREFRTLVENLPDAIFRYDTEARRVYVNPIGLRLTGRTLEELQGTTPEELPLTSALFAKDMLQSIQRVVDTGVVLETSLQQVDGQGTLRSYLTRLGPELDAKGKVVGVLSIMRDITELKAREAELEASRMQLRELSEHRDAVLEEERKRIARELHEELGQVLTALRLTISMLRVEYGATMPILKERSHAMTELVDRAIHSMREVVTTLRPSVLDAGVMAALEWLVQDMRKHTGLECTLVASERIVLSRDRSLGLFRIVQEALTNAVRHARASQADVDIERVGAQWFVRIQDNGVGFDPDAPRSAKSFGLLGMRERAHALDGELSITSAPGQGTQVRMVFPVHESDSEAGL